MNKMLFAESGAIERPPDALNQPDVQWLWYFRIARI